MDSTAQLALTPEPTAVAHARRWVRAQLIEWSHPDLVEAAVLGVSELVTNAVLHVRGGITVQLVDAESTVRVEVYDDSRSTLNEPALDDDREPSTVGRGLGIVASVSEAWGVELLDSGKRVWFEPASAANRNPCDLDERLLVDPSSERSAEDLVEISLIDIPVNLLQAYRHRYRDLRREMTLIAMNEDAADSVPARLHAIAKRVDSYREFASGTREVLERAVAEQRDRATTTFRLPRDVAGPVQDLMSVLEEADGYCREEQLLALAVGPQAKELRDWIYGQVVAQARGEDPKPWPGGFEPTDPPAEPAPTDRPE